MRPVGSHGVGARHGAQSHRMLVCALVAHHSYAAYRGEQHRTGLPHLVIQRLAVLTDVVVHVLDVDVVGVLQYAYFLARDVTEYAHCQPRAWERMALDEPFGHLQLVTYAAHLVLEQPLQRLAELQVHLLGQSA